MSESYYKFSLDRLTFRQWAYSFLYDNAGKEFFNDCKNVVDTLQDELSSNIEYCMNDVNARSEKFKKQSRAKEVTDADRMEYLRNVCDKPYSSLSDIVGTLHNLHKRINSSSDKEKDKS